MRKFYSIFALCAFLFLSGSSYATDYTVEPTTAIKARSLPIYMQSSSTTTSSITQQIFWPSELKDDDDNLATAGDITAVTFYYAAGSSNASAFSRGIQIWLMDTTTTSYSLSYQSTQWTSKFITNSDKKAGTKVYAGSLNTEAVSTTDDVKSVKITFNVPFHWDGESNIVMTVVDSTKTQIGSNAYNNLKFYITEVSPSRARFLHKYWTGSDQVDSWVGDLDRYGDAYGSLVNDSATMAGKRKYVPKTTFSITPTIPAPTNLAANSITTSSATLSWDAAAGATGYNVRWGKTSGSLDHSQNNVAATSLAISDLDDGETYYFDVQTITAGGTSAFSSEANFNTAAVTHEHNGISFNKWASTTSLPTSGNYFLNTDVELASDWNVTENINLCLNGHKVYTETNSIQVKDGATFAIYDNEGGGRIYGYFVANYPEYGLINIENGGTLVLSEGIIQNLYGSYEEDDDPDDKSLSNAIYNNGTLKLSGALTFTSYHADIYLGSNKYITIESEKPLTNSEPYSVYKSGKSVITSGWANMNGADPKDYFVSANTSLNIKMGETEAEFYPVISLSENNTNTAIGTYSDQMVDVNLTRSLTPSQYNTFCLPFALDDDQLQELFGDGYDLEKLTGSSLDGDELTLTFDKVTALEAGKPYLLKPSVEVTNPSFEGVTIGATAPVDIETSLIDFKGTFAPTNLEVGNHNILCLGASNSLFWPNTSNPIKGFRAYFEVKGDAKKAKAARIVKKEDQAQALDNIENTRPAQKRILNGQLVIEKNGTLYNAQGQIVK